MNNNFDTQSLLKEINIIINNGVQDIVKNYMKRYELLEQTHDSLVNLPIVKQYYTSDKSDASSSVSFVPIKVEKLEHLEKNEEYVTRSENKQFMITIDEKINTLLQQNNDLFNKLLSQLSELKSEIDVLKQDKKKIEYIDIEKENIKLEFVDIKQEKELDFAVNESKTEEDEEEIVEVCEEEEEEEEEQEEEEEDEEEEDEEIASVETETKAEQEEEEDEEELIEIEIDDVTYCTNDEENGSIYELDKDGNVGKKVGYLKDGDAYFDE